MASVEGVEVAGDSEADVNVAGNVADVDALDVKFADAYVADDALRFSSLGSKVLSCGLWKWFGGRLVSTVATEVMASVAVRLRGDA